jgi:SpoVK/Ycf46/Vps4 family AAA+-type ATPase
VAFNNREFLGDIIRDHYTVQYMNDKKPDRKFIRCLNTREDIQVRDISFDDVILPPDIKQDIITSADVFFKRNAMYDQLGLSRKRGFLFTGSPGNGKTLLCHALAGYLHDTYGVYSITISINRLTDNDDIKSLYDNAEQNSPSLVILEDIESIMTDTYVTRSVFLNILDGLYSANGLLTIATTNYPEKLDPALAHRPSRFDRVWTIPTPDKSQRREYLEFLVADLITSKDIINTLVDITAGWSMAYIQELKATAAVFAIQQDHDHLAEADLLKAANLLQAQFKSGTKNHREEAIGTVGFNAA